MKINQIPNVDDIPMAPEEPSGEFSCSHRKPVLLVAVEGWPASSVRYDSASDGDGVVVHSNILRYAAVGVYA